MRISIKHVANLLNSQLNFHFYSIITAESKKNLPFAAASTFPKDCFISISTLNSFISTPTTHSASIHSFSSKEMKNFKLQENCHELLGLEVFCFHSFSCFCSTSSIIYLGSANFCFLAIIFFTLIILPMPHATHLLGSDNEVLNMFINTNACMRSYCCF